ncbi:MAG: type II 3-dehydroquinate dehydratase [Bacteroidales bacterium]|nr:type II 3-dehydroquinate dehydratase [Bacteroidales bacterium]
MKILVLNGPNLNMLGIRERAIYGAQDYAALERSVLNHAEKHGDSVEFFQSNHEGALVDRIQQAYFDGVEGIVFNPGAYTHTSIALLDALKAVNIPCVEVHISNVAEREAFRQISYIRAACIETIAGHGLEGYLEAIDCLREYASNAH